MLRPIAIATAVCGTLDILFAMILTCLARQGIRHAALRRVRPFPGRDRMGSGGAVLGLVVHFALMAIMATMFVLLSADVPHLLDTPILAGVVYGLVTYVVMNLIVVPLRFHPPCRPSRYRSRRNCSRTLSWSAFPFALITAADPATGCI